MELNDPSSSPPALSYATPEIRRDCLTSLAVACMGLAIASAGVYAAEFFELVPRFGALRNWELDRIAGALGVAAALLALFQFVKYRRHRRGNRLALAGLLIATAASIGSIRFGPGRNATTPSRHSMCSSNLRQIGQGLLIYAMDHGDRFPDTFDGALEEGVPVSRFVCPSSNDSPATGPTTQALAANLTAGGHLSYIYLGKGLTSSAVQAEFVLAYEPLAHHHLGMNVLFGDGRVDFVPLPTAQRMIAELNDGHNPPRPEKMSAGPTTR